MFVLEALVLTFMTTPLVTWFYPPHLRRRTTALGPNFHDTLDDEAARNQRVNSSSPDEDLKTRFTVVLDKLENLPAMMALTQLIQPSLSQPRSLSMQRDTSPHSITIEALRLIELSDRVSAVMKSSISSKLLLTDPMLSIFRMFGHLKGVKVSPALSVVKFSDLASSIAEHAKNHDSDMILIPWLPPVYTFDGHHPPTPPVENPQPLLAPSMTPNPTTASNNTMSALRTHLSNTPFDIFFKSSGGVGNGGGDTSNPISLIHSQFVRGVFARSQTDVALFVDQSTLDSTSIVGGSSSSTLDVLHQHIFLPFFGGPDDRLALDFVVQICANPKVRGTVVRITKCDDGVAGNEEIQSGALTPAKVNEGFVPENPDELNRLTVDSVSL